ncbi:FkbM family methyltransferase [Nocardia mexicana]|uniref:FkbM family methyltransferase n=1 Tax=Nocardia mexicana TaxID=279262 RepID=A0A370GMN7_9NOCA|nr:FkbM family methyltransferase [Nocardia mexicana]RDI44907.1 FkbM family methyltransferase [Nocardia mexicana]
MSSRTSWQHTVLTPRPWPPLLIAARWWVRYGPGTVLEQRLARDWLDVGLRQRPRPPRVVRTRYRGRFQIPTTIDFISRAIYTHGCWEACVSALVASRLRPGDRFIDLGAAGGWYSVLAARRVGPSGGVVAVEPAPAALEQLHVNLILNRCTNVRVVRAAVTAEPGPVRLYVPDRGNSGATTTIPPDDHISQFTAPGLPLADLLQPGDLENARMIKVDVEGAEGTVLAQLSRLISRLRPDCEILTEITPKWLAAAGHTADEVLKPLTDNGFRAYRVPNSYAPEDMTRAARHPLAPTPLTGPITEQADLLLTRGDALPKSTLQ